VAALRRHHANVTATARLLGMERTAFARKLRDLAIIIAGPGAAEDFIILERPIGASPKPATAGQGHSPCGTVLHSGARAGRRGSAIAKQPRGAENRRTTRKSSPPPGTVVLIRGSNAERPKRPATAFTVTEQGN
jgi:hypothetical protein